MASALEETNANRMRNDLVYSQESLEKGNVQITVAKKTMRYIPFVTSEEEIAYYSPFAKITLGGLGVGHGIENDETGEKREQLRKDFWRRNKGNAYRALNHRRANMSTLMGKKFRGKYW